MQGQRRKRTSRSPSKGPQPLSWCKAFLSGKCRNQNCPFPHFDQATVDKTREGFARQRHIANLKPKATPKIEQIFVGMLESLHPEEAMIVLYMKDKDLGGRYKGLTKKLASDAFPGLINQ